MNVVVKNAMILDGSNQEDRAAKMARDAVQVELEKMGISVSCTVLQDISIAPCKGCLKCWTKTPGDCIINDAQTRIYSEMARSDLIILVTPITFGGYSSELKKSLDRFIPDLLPFFKKFGSEIHHPVRYGNGWRLLGLGTLPGPSEVKERIFRDLVEHNSRNMHSPRQGSVVLYKDATAEEVTLLAVNGLKKVVA